jgi:hypothetical protein
VHELSSRHVHLEQASRPWGTSSSNSRGLDHHQTRGRVQTVCHQPHRRGSTVSTTVAGIDRASVIVGHRQQRKDHERVLGGWRILPLPIRDRTLALFDEAYLSSSETRNQAVHLPDQHYASSSLTASKAAINGSTISVMLH